MNAILGFPNDTSEQTLSQALQASQQNQQPNPSVMEGAQFSQAPNQHLGASTAGLRAADVVMVSPSQQQLPAQSPHISQAPPSMTYPSQSAMYNSRLPEMYPPQPSQPPAVPAWQQPDPFQATPADPMLYSSIPAPIQPQPQFQATTQPAYAQRAGLPPGAQPAMTIDVAKMQQWTPDHVAGWLMRIGYPEMTRSFRKNNIDGSALIRLKDHHLREMMTSSNQALAVGRRLRLMDQIELVRRVAIKPNTRMLEGPSYAKMVFDMLSFGWADTAEGKTAQEMKSESENVNYSVAVVSALVWTIAWGMFFGAATSCYCLDNNPLDCWCAAGYDIREGDALEVFYAFGGASAIFFMWSTLFAVFQVIMVNEMSDDLEVTQFLNDLGSSAQLPGNFMVLGTITIHIPIIVYVLFAYDFGLYQVHDLYKDNVRTAFAYICALVVMLLLLWNFYAKIPFFVSYVYNAKVNTIRRDLEALQQPSIAH